MNPPLEYKELSAEEVCRQIETDKADLLLVDILPNDHFLQVHLPSARNACVFEVTFLDQIAELAPSKETRMIVYGFSSTSRGAETAAEKLIRNGYLNVALLKDGLSGWRRCAFPLEGEAPDQPDEPASTPAFEERTHTVDTEESTIEWTGRNPNTRHFGTIALSHGELTVAGGTLTGTFEIDMQSIKNINLEGDELQPVLISHLKSDDFFFVDRFPKATFTLTRATPVKEPTLTAPNYTVDGILELLDTKAPLEFQATINPLNNGKLTAEAHFDIDKTQWNIIYGSSRFFEHLGMHVVFDLISIQLKIVTK